MSNFRKNWIRGRAKMAWQATFVATLPLVLAACGGGGGGSSAPEPPPNAAPTLTGNLNPSFPENSNVGFSLSVEDADGDDVTITIGNSQDGQFFLLDTGTGNISATQVFDFENPQDVDGDNVYEQSVTLDDGTTQVTRTVTVTITDVNEAPTCEDVALVRVDENSTGEVVTLVGGDPDAGDADSVRYSLAFVNPIDLVDSFSIDAISGVLSLTAPLDADTLDPGDSARLLPAPDENTFAIDAGITIESTGSLNNSCLVTIGVTDLPSQVASGVLLDGIIEKAQGLADLDGDTVDELWIAKQGLSDGAPASASLLWGSGLRAAIAANGGAELELSNLNAATGLEVSGSFPAIDNSPITGQQGQLSANSVADLDGDGLPELLVTLQDASQSGVAVERPWGLLVWGQTLANITNGTLDLDSLAPAEALSLVGQVEVNRIGLEALVQDFDGDGLAEILFLEPGALLPGGEEGQLHYIQGARIAAEKASGLYRFSTDLQTRVFSGSFDINDPLKFSGLTTIADINGDTQPELVASSPGLLSVVSGATLATTPSGGYSSLQPVSFALGTTSAPLLLNTPADIDGDANPDLLFARNDHPARARANLLFGSTLAANFTPATTSTLNSTNFPAPAYVEFELGGLDIEQTNRTFSLGDLDGDGRDEMALAVVDSTLYPEGVVFILRGSEASNLLTTQLDLDGFDASQGTLIQGFSAFPRIGTEMLPAPDVDADGNADLLLISRRAENLAAILTSSDIRAALQSNQLEINLADLLFVE